MSVRIPCWFALALLVAQGTASAQNFSGDARKIGMGGVGYSENIATRMIDEERPYSSIVLPLGLIQLYRDRHHFDPDDDRFDPVLALEYAANPLHIVFGRDPGGTRGRFVEDLGNGELSRDLNSYRGFVPANKIVAEGLASPNWGKTFKFQRRNDGTFHGFYVGAGPYLSAKTVLNIDKALTDVFSSTTPVQVRNSTFSITDGSIGQVALAVTGGYRGRIAWPGRSRAGGSSREGLYIGANYHYLHGFRYEAADILFRFDTDAAGLVAMRPATAPAVVDYFNSRSGRGFALDFGLAAVIGGWEFGFGANGVANRIEWQKLRLKRYRLQSLVEGGEFIEQSLPADPSSVRVELPVDYTGSGAYHRGGWSVVTEVSHGFQGPSFHSGLERRFGAIEFRGGGRYALDRWHPTGGVGFNMGQRVSLDLGVFGTTTNIERQLRPALAVSLRLNRVR